MSKGSRWGGSRIIGELGEITAKELAALRRDRERLDWRQERFADYIICRTQVGNVMMFEILTTITMAQVAIEPTLRDAIDKAREGEG
ncbi:MAG: hypothetical protein V3S71_06480 [Acidobacteriota bacterium]